MNENTDQEKHNIWLFQWRIPLLLRLDGNNVNICVEVK